MIITYSRYAQYKIIALNTIKRYFGLLPVAIEKYEALRLTSNIDQTVALSSNIDQTLSLNSKMDIETAS